MEHKGPRSPRDHGWGTLHDWSVKLDRHPKTIRRYCADGLEHSKIGADNWVHESAWPKYFASKARGGNRRGER